MRVARNELVAVGGEQHRRAVPLNLWVPARARDARAVVVGPARRRCVRRSAASDVVICVQSAVCAARVPEGALFGGLFPYRGALHVGRAPAVALVVPPVWRRDGIRRVAGRDHSSGPAKDARVHRQRRGCVARKVGARDRGVCVWVEDLAAGWVELADPPHMPAPRHPQPAGLLVVVQVCVDGPRALAAHVLQDGLVDGAGVVVSQVVGEGVLVRRAAAESDHLDLAD
mmetsp:Transcript_20884/g.66494  ORF Transcript_20884/g.66494 Transcript_20884/m.66494 type:complete len:228 (+) Transcript_20884:587-1270(+)